MANNSSVEKQTASADTLAEKIKDHVVQIEILTLLVIYFILITSFRSEIRELLGSWPYYFLVFGSLASLPLFVRVTNPISDIRSRLVWAGAGAGFGGGTGGAIAGAFVGAAAGPVGALIGICVGIIAGVWWGPKIEHAALLLPPPPKPTALLTGPKLFTQGEARLYLLDKSATETSLTTKEIEGATEFTPEGNDVIPSIDIDGVRKFRETDITLWLEKRKAQKSKNPNELI